MNDKAKTKKQLIEELQALRQQVTALPESLQQVDSAQIPLRTWFDNVADPIIIFDRETNRFLDCNQATIDRYGYTLDELRTMTPHQLHPPEEHETGAEKH